MGKLLGELFLKNIIRNKSAILKLVVEDSIDYTITNSSDRDEIKDTQRKFRG
jgi:hypothetical protein